MKKKIEIDIIIVSFAQNSDLKEVTIGCIKSLMRSEKSDKIKFNVIVVESEKSMAPYQYPDSLTLYPDSPFGYHRYMNIGIKATSADYVCICNNDLSFHENWATEILKPLQIYADVYSASPICSIHHPKHGFKLNDGIKIGMRIRYELCGWCLFFKRDLLKKIGQLDENYIFWCADNDYSNTLILSKMYHVLVTSSIVDHLESKTLNLQSDERKLELTDKETVYFLKKWNPRTGTDWLLLD